MEPGLAEKYLHDLKMLFACKEHSEEDILGSFSVRCVRSFYPVSRMMNADKYINVIQRKVMIDMKKAFPDGGGIFQQPVMPAAASGSCRPFSHNLHLPQSKFEDQIFARWHKILWPI